MADKVVTDTQNQRLYLENLAKSGTPGQQAWAKDQLANFDNIYSDAQSTQPIQNNNSMNDIMNALAIMSGAYMQQQQAMLEATRQNQLANLQKAYSDAVAQGKMSIRDAEDQYVQQLNAINQAAYQDAERTKLYGQNMGLSNSQQMVGLMQADNARKNSLLNQNMTIRDKRINDIRDRINAITAQRDLDIANVNAQYDAGLQQAMATAMMNMGNNAFGLLQNDYLANREHQRALELSNIEYERAKEMMDKEQRFALEKMEKEYGYSVAKAKLSASLEAQIRESEREKELLELLRSYKINPDDPEALYKLRMRQNAESAETDKQYEIAHSDVPLPEDLNSMEAFNAFLPFIKDKYVTHKDKELLEKAGLPVGIYRKEDVLDYMQKLDAVKRARAIFGIEE